MESQEIKKVEQTDEAGKTEEHGPVYVLWEKNGQPYYTFDAKEAEAFARGNPVHIKRFDNLDAALMDTRGYLTPLEEA